MKKFLSMLLAIVMLVSLCACSGSESPPTPSDILVSETWVSPRNITLTFYPTGSGGVGEKKLDSKGVFQSYPSSITTFTWEVDESDNIVLTFAPGFSQQPNFALELVNGIYHFSSLSDGGLLDNIFFTRESECDADTDFNAFKTILSENWVNSYGTTVTFHSNGTGIINDGMNAPNDMTWEYLGDQTIRLRYVFIGQSKIADFIFEQVDEVYRLTSVSNPEMYYVRDSDYQS